MLIRCIKIFSLLMLASAIAKQAQAQKAFEVGDEVKNSHHVDSDVISTVNHTVIVSDTLSGWHYNWIGGLHGSQSSYQNYSNGGVNAVSGTASTVFQAEFRHKRFAYALETNVKYGRAYLADEGNRKTEDNIAINSKVSYRFKNHEWNAFGNVNITSQFDQGFDYDGPDSLRASLISNFLAPAYISEIAGIGYTPSASFILEGGLTLKETIIRDDALSTKYNLSPGDNFRLEPGFSFRVGFKKQIVKNVLFSSNIGTFTNVQRSLKDTDFKFENELIGKINDFLNMTFDFNAIYNDDFTGQIQIKEVLSAGLSVTLH